MSTENTTEKIMHEDIDRKAYIIMSLSVAANCILNRSALTDSNSIQNVVSDLQDAIGILAAGLSRPPTAH